MQISNSVVQNLNRINIFRIKPKFFNNQLERSPKADTISFESQRKTYNTFLKNKTQSDFPKRIYDVLVENVEKGNGNKEVNILDIHNEIYKGLKEAKTLDEAKALYPEFEGVIELEEAYKYIKPKNQILKDMLSAKIEQPEGSLALYLLKCNYQLQKNEIFKDNFMTDRVLKLLNIQKMPRKYSQLICRYVDGRNLSVSQRLSERWQDPEYREKMSQQLQENWQNPEFRENMLRSQDNGR